MTIVFYISAAVFFGVMSGQLAYFITSKISGRPAENHVKTSFPAEHGEKTISNAIKYCYSRITHASITEDPSSKEPRKIKMAFALAIFLLMALITGKIIFGLMASAGTFLGLDAYRSRIKKNKTALFNDQLIEALGVITSSVRAGQSFVQALENLARDAKPPLSIELDRAIKSIRLGTPVNQALLEMSEKVNSNDLKISVISINLARESGGNMGEILTSIAETIRERKKIRGKITALTAQGKMSGIVMGAVPFLLLGALYFIQPSIMSLLFSTFLGNIMLLTVAVMITLGMLVINKIVNIDI